MGRDHLFIDDVTVCRDRVLGAVIVADSESGMLSLTIRHDVQGSAALATSTERLALQELVIRIGHRIVTRPVVLEPILTGELVINGVERGVRTATRLSALAPC